MTLVQELARFVVARGYEDLSAVARRELRLRILDALGCAIGALGGPPIRILREQIRDFGGREICGLVGGGRTAPDRAALYNGALVRYLDFNDSYLAAGETCHPSDNLAPVLAAAETAGATGRELLAALAVSYQVQCRLSDVAPVRRAGFDHTTQGAYAVAAGVAKALRLDSERTAHAIAISGTALNALRVTRTGRLSHWKGLAYPHTAFGATHASFLAMRGITGPEEVFEGNKGFMDAIAGRFTIDWQGEDLERVTRTIVKRYNAEIHSQATLEGALEIREERNLAGGAGIASVEVETFGVAFHIIGGGEEGDKKSIRTKEEADHSLPYMVAVALLDGEVGPRQYDPERIARQDVQDLLRRVTVRPREDYSERFPEEMACRVLVRMVDGRTFEKEKRDYEGFHTRPMSWKRAVAKFDSLAGTRVGAGDRQEIVEAVERIEEIAVSDLLRLLTRIPDPEGRSEG